MSNDHSASDATGPWRFVAGALCPACGAEDRLRMRMGPAGQERSCVQCGHNEQLLAQSPVAGVPGGRLDPEAAVAVDLAALQPVRILDHGAGSTGNNKSSNNSNDGSNNR